MLHRGRSLEISTGACVAAALLLVPIDQASAEVCLQSPPGIVSWWPGEDDARDIVGRNNGTIQGAVAFKPGAVGLGFGLDGNGFVLVPDNPTLHLTNQLTIELWFAFDGVVEDFMGLIAKRNDATGTNYGVNTQPSLGFGVYYNDPAVTGGDDYECCGSILEVSRLLPVADAGRFHHLAATYTQIDSNSISIDTFVDGRLVRRKLLPGDLRNAVNTDPVTIGATGPDGSEPFRGTIDEVTIYNRALRSTEIEALFVAGGAGKCRGVTIVTPNTPSRWGINTRQRLAWTYEGDAPQFQIDISRDGGDTWDFLSVVPNRVGGSQNFFWTVTGPSTPNAKLRVTAIGDEEATDVNDADVSIAPASIEILRPSGRMSVAFGRPLSIFLRHNLGARTLIAIDVSNDGGATWRRVVSGTRTNGSTTSSYPWVVDILPTTRGRLRIQAQDASGASAVSPLFTVVARQRPLEVIGGSLEIGATREGDVTFSIRSPEVTIEGEAHGDAGGLGIITPRCPEPCPVISGVSRGGLSSKVGFRPMPQGSSDELLSGELFFRTPAAVFFCGPPDGFCVGSAPFTFTGVMSRHDESGRLLASYEFVGSGTAQGLFQQDGHLLGVTYTFAANPRLRALDRSGARDVSRAFGILVTMDAQGSTD
jgi:hypothetical protein